MAENKFFLGGDFKIKYELFDKAGVRLPIGNKPFTLKYYNPNDPKKFIIASFDGTHYINIQPKSNYYNVCLQNPQFEVGRLFCEEVIKEADSDFSDSFREEASTYDIGAIARYISNDDVVNVQTNFRQIINPSFDHVISPVLPGAGSLGTYYFTPSGVEGVSNISVWTPQQGFQKVGDTTLNLTDFQKKSDTEIALADKVGHTEFENTFKDYKTSFEVTEDIAAAKSELQGEIGKKVDATTFDATKADLLTSIGEKLNTTTFNEEKTAINTEIGKKINSVDFNSKLADIPTKSDMNAAIAAIANWKRKIVEVLPEIGEETTLYLLPIENPDGDNYYDEYYFQDGKAEHFGDTKVNLTDYPKKSEIPSYLTEYVTKDSLATTLEGYATTAVIGNINTILDTINGEVI